MTEEILINEASDLMSVADSAAKSASRRFNPMTKTAQAEQYAPANDKIKSKSARRMAEIALKEREKGGVVGPPETSEKRRINRLFGSRRKSTQPRQGKSRQSSIEIAEYQPMLAVNNSNMLPETNPANNRLINFEDSSKFSQHKMMSR